MGFFRIHGIVLVILFCGVLSTSAEAQFCGPSVQPSISVFNFILRSWAKTPEELEKQRKRKALEDSWTAIGEDKFKQTLFLNKMEKDGHQSVPSFSAVETKYLAEYAPKYLRRDEYLAFKAQTMVDQYFPTFNDKIQAYTSFLSLAFPTTWVGKAAGISNATLGVLLASDEKDFVEGLLGLLPYGKVAQKGTKTFFYFADKTFDVTDLLPAELKALHGL